MSSKLSPGEFSEDRKPGQNGRIVRAPVCVVKFDLIGLDLIFFRGIGIPVNFISGFDPLGIRGSVQEIINVNGCRYRCRCRR